MHPPRSSFIVLVHQYPTILSFVLRRLYRQYTALTMTSSPKKLPIAAGTTPIRFVPLVVVDAAAEAVLVVEENEVIPALPPDVLVPDAPPAEVDTVVPPVVIAAPSLLVVEGGIDIDIDPGHCPGKEMVEDVGAGKLASIAEG